MADSKKYNGSTWEHSLRKLTTATDTLTTLPADIYADGTNATVGISGNTVQSGTPTPDNPIMPEGTGDRTGNLLDKTEFTGVSATIEQIEDGIRIITPSGGFAARIILDVLQNTNYTVSYIWKRISGNSTNTVRVFAGTDTSTEIAVFDYKTGGTFNTGNNTKINIWFYAYAVPGTTATVEYTKIMLNLGSEALPYEPYGYKIPISSASTTTPVYLGEVESTRQIRKLVLTGNEDWEIDVQAGHQVAFLSLNPIGIESSLFKPHGVCTHYPVEYNNTDGYARIMNNGTLLRIMDDSKAVDRATWTAFLAAQYATGTPVCIWYVLAEPETGIVNEPLMKIGDYADTVSGITVPTITSKDTFDVETTLKPSEASLSYTGWHDASVREWDGSQWNE